MKILITTDWYRPVINGVVTSVLNLTEQLEKRGYEVKVLTLSRNCHSYKEENVIYAGSVGMGKIYPQARVKIPVVAREYMEELLAWNPDLIHSQCEFSTFFLAKRIAGELDIPIIHTYHTVYEDYTHYQYQDFLKSNMPMVCNLLAKIIIAVCIILKNIRKIGRAHV